MTIDWWTLGIQTVNVMILMWLLQRFFWRPVSAMIEQRRAAIQLALAGAKTAQDKADAAMSGIAQTRAGFAQEHDAIVAEAHHAAEQAKAQALAEAVKTEAAQQEATRAALAQEDADAQSAWSHRASQLAVEIAGRLAARLKGPAVDAAFLDWLLASLRAVPSEARQEAGSAALQAVSASPIPAADQDRIRTLIAEALGGHPVIAFSTDPALIAGLELHGPHFSVTNSWRADLDQVLAGLQHAA
jgi:F-type H+-transporting ATPase subunit b